MVTIGMNYEVLDGKADVFERAFAGVLGALNGTAGHVQSRLYKDVSAPLSYLIVSEWDDREAFGRFIASEQFARVTNWGKEQILSGPPRHRVYGG
jgi:heme-degrading monooxygenase HmoA